MVEKVNKTSDDKSKKEDLSLKESMSYRYTAMSEAVKDADFSSKDTWGDTAKKTVETVRVLGKDMTGNVKDIKEDVDRSDRTRSGNL